LTGDPALTYQQTAAMTKGDRARPVGTAVTAVLAGLLVLGGAYLVQHAVALRVDYWDAYLYLNNARAFLGDAEAAYALDKPPVVPALFAPAVALTRGASPSGTQLIVPHLVSAGLSILSALAVFLALVQALSPRRWATQWALAGTVLFVGNRIFLHYGALALTDVVSAGLVAAVFACWFRARAQRRWGWFFVTGGFIGLAAAARYQLVMVPFALIAAELLIAFRQRSIADRRALGLVVASVVGAGIFLVAHKLAFEAVGREWSISSLMDALEYAGAGAQRDQPTEEPEHYLAMLWVAMSPLVLVLAAGGVIFALVRRTDHDLLFIAWLLVVGGPLFRVDHNEIRYLFAAFPALVYFAIAPLSVLVARSSEKAWLTRRFVLPAASIAAAVALAIALWPGVDQARRDADPFFRTDVERTTSAWLLARRGAGARLVWYGKGVGLHPPYPVVFVEDEFFNVFHMGPHVIEYFTGTKVEYRPWQGDDPVALAAREDTLPAAFVIGPRTDVVTARLLSTSQASTAVEVLSARRTRWWREGDVFSTSDGVDGTLRVVGTSLVPSETLGEGRLVRARGPMRRFELRAGEPVVVDDELTEDDELELILIERGVIGRQ
jgi:hypothetical protein